jgi:hypothetical protein
MQSFGTALRLMLVFALALMFLGLAPQSSLAQTVSVSPGDLSFGVPTGTVSPYASAPDNVVVTITGSVTFGTVIVSGTNAADFIIDGNSCTGTIAAPNSCQVSVHFNASLAPAATLETATLTINSNAPTVAVPMNGAYGAIKLFSALNVNPSLFPGVTWPAAPGNPVKTTSINLSCPPSPTALLSSTPGYTAGPVSVYGNVFQDNTIQVADTYPIGGTPVITSNVCYGGDTNFSGFTGFPAGTTNCFQQAYEGYAGSVLGMNPDLVPGLVSTYGVQPLNLQNPPGSLFSPVLVAGHQSLNVQLTDAGGDLGAATLHLVTNCTASGISPGGSVTLNPISTGNPSSLTQTATFSNTPGQNISFTTSVATAVAEGYTPPSGIVPIVTDFGIPQSTFNQLVTGTSAAPAVCLRLSGELDSLGNPLCKGYQIQCYDPSKGTTTGDNCTPTFSNSRDLYDAAQFASPDAPAPTAADPSQNFLSPSSPVNACRNLGTVANPIVCAAGTGPGMLLGGDNWLISPYAPSNCALTGGLTGYPCPLDTLTALYGAADLSSGSTTFGKNSIFIPVVNMPLPFTVTTITGQNANGWLNSWTINASFVAQEASYSSATLSNPGSNGFKAAAPYSVTYGLTSPGVAIPDSTYPIATDTTQYADPNAMKTTGGNITPPGSIANCTTSTPAAFFNAADTFSVTSDGIYNLHYFTTDCALSEGLAFNPTLAQLTNPTSNWASFPVTAIGVDTAKPTVSNVLAVPPVLFLNQPFTLTYQCADSTAPGSGLHTCDTSLSNNIAAVTTSPVSVGQPAFSGSHVIPTGVPLPAAGTGVPVAAGQSISVTAQDFAGNTVTTTPQAYSVQYETPAVACGPAGKTSASRTFLAPVGPDPVLPGMPWAGVKKGHSVPYAFRLCDYAGNSIGASGPVITNIAVQMIGDNGGDTAEDIADAIEDTNFHWDASCQYWIYNLGTSDKEKGVKYIYTLTLKDGTTLQFALSVK